MYWELLSLSYGVEQHFKFLHEITNIFRAILCRMHVYPAKMHTTSYVISIALDKRKYFVIAIGAIPIFTLKISIAIWWRLRWWIVTDLSLFRKSSTLELLPSYTIRKALWCIWLLLLLRPIRPIVDHPNQWAMIKLWNYKNVHQNKAFIQDYIFRNTR